MNRASEICGTVTGVTVTGISEEKKEGKQRGLKFFFCYSLSHVPLFVTPGTVACQAPLSMGFSRLEYWSGLPFPSPGNLPDPGIQPVSLTSPALAGRFITTSAIWEVAFYVAADQFLFIQIEWK